MREPDLLDALISLNPECQVAIHGEKIEWIVPKEPSHTIDEIKAELVRLQEQFQSQEYQRLRKPEYPELADFADAYYWAQQGDDTKMNEYLAKIREIKEKFPKG